MVSAETSGDVILSFFFAWVQEVGNFIIDYIQFEIGGSQIDKHWGSWMDVWYELTHTVDQERGYNKMVGDVAELTLRSLKYAVAGTLGVPAILPISILLILPVVPPLPTEIVTVELAPLGCI